MHPANKRYSASLDISLASCLLFILIALLINTSLHSILLVYIPVLLALFLCGFLTLRFRNTENTLRDSWILGSLSLIFYPFVDFYLRPNRHDGPSRIRMECDINDIPYYWTQKNPNKEDAINSIKENYQKKGKV